MVLLLTALACVPALGGGGCRYDDGSTEDALAITGFGEDVWMHAYGAPGDRTLVRSISTAYGSACCACCSPANGTAAHVAIWDDPNDDGDPADAVLLQLVDTTVQGVDTDALSATMLSPPVIVDGVYFVGAGALVLAQTVIPLDASASGPAWIFSNQAGVADFTNPSANGIPPFPMGVGFLLRADCEPVPSITPFCSGDGTTAACPCANPGLAGHGCENSSSTGGSVLSGSGSASLSVDTFVMTASGERPSALSIFWQGGGNAPPRAIGDGLTCLGSPRIRLYARRAVLGAVTAPQGSDASVSVSSAAAGDPIAAGSTRVYHVLYRDPDPVFCPTPVGSTFNASGGLRVLWGP